MDYEKQKVSSLAGNSKIFADHQTVWCLFRYHYYSFCDIPFDWNVTEKVMRILLSKQPMVLYVAYEPD